MYLQMETLASTVMKMEDSHMKEMSILILMLKNAKNMLRKETPMQRFFLSAQKPAKE